MARTRMATLTFTLSEVFSLIVLDAILRPLNNLKSFGIMKLQSYVEYVLTTCLVQE